MQVMKKEKGKKKRKEDEESGKGFVPRWCEHPEPPRSRHSPTSGGPRESKSRVGSRARYDISYVVLMLLYA